MLHRAGNVDGEGDGCGLLIDIPRKIWAEEIRHGGHASKLALDRALRSATSSSRAGRAMYTRPGEARETDESDRPAGARRARERGRLPALGPHRARGGAGLLADRRPDRGAQACFEIVVPLEEAFDCTSPPSHRHLRLQGAGRAKRARPLLPRPPRRPRRRPRRCSATTATRRTPGRPSSGCSRSRARPQRRDQHDRAPAPGGAHAGRAAHTRTARTRRT